MFYKKGVLRNFAKFTGKHLCYCLFFKSFSTLLKKSLWHKCFLVNFEKFVRKTFLSEHLWANASSYSIIVYMTSWPFTEILFSLLHSQFPSTQTGNFKSLLFNILLTIWKDTRTMASAH